MMRTRREILGAAGVGVLLAKLPSALDASDKPEPKRNDDGLYTQPWFHESFLDLNHTSKLMIPVSHLIPKFAQDASPEVVANF